MRFPRRNFEKRPPATRINRRIKAPTVRVVDDKGSQIGVLSIEEALAKAEEMRLDLVEVSPDSKPPVCRLVDYGKYKYLQKKNTKKSKPSPVKEVKLRPHIGQHDLDVKMERLRGFLQDGCKAKLRVMFRGREFVHKNTGFELISSIVEQLSGLGKIDSPARLEGRGIVAVLSPVKSAGGEARRENGAYEDEEAVKDGEAV